MLLPASSSLWFLESKQVWGWEQGLKEDVASLSRAVTAASCLRRVCDFLFPRPFLFKLSTSASQWALRGYPFSSLTQCSLFTPANMTPWERIEGDIKSCIETALTARIKAALRRKTSEDLGRAVDMFIDWLSAINTEWWVFKSLEWKTKKKRVHLVSLRILELNNWFQFWAE